MDILQEALRQFQDLEVSNNQDKETIQQQKVQISRLKAAIRALVPEEEEVVDEASTTLQGVKSQGTESEAHKPEIEAHESQTVNNDSQSDDEHESDSELIGIWDSIDRVYRCTACSWEIIDGVCQNVKCCLEHEYPEDHQENDLDVDMSRTVVTDDEALISDRRLAPRGTTPIQDMPILPTDPEEWSPLLARGANRSMCSKYNLEFTYETGIVAWADEDLLAEFSGPAMVEGDRWKIYLGRRVELEQRDNDGSVFMQNLLEEVQIWPIAQPKTSRLYECWETVKTEPGIWVTRPVIADERDIVYPTRKDEEEEDEISTSSEEYDSEIDTGSDCGMPLKDVTPAVFRDEYEDTSGSDEAEDEDEEKEDSESVEESEDEPDWAIQARAPDGYYEPDTESEVSTESDIVDDADDEDEDEFED